MRAVPKMPTNQELYIRVVVSKEQYMTSPTCESASGKGMELSEALFPLIAHMLQWKHIHGTTDMCPKQSGTIENKNYLTP